MHSDSQTLVVPFSIEGNLCYLSHLETMAMFQRALVRSGISLCFSEGFNPRPRMSLPLPRSVGMISQGDRLCAQVCEPNSKVDAMQIGDRLAQQLPDGCCAQPAELHAGRASFQPVGAEYVFSLRPAGRPETGRKVEAVRNRLASGEAVLAERRLSRGGTKQRDLRPYLKSLRSDSGRIVVEYAIRPDGSVRIDEIMSLLDIERGDLAEPVRRRSVQWVRTK